MQYDIKLIKGNFFGNALDFVEKASVCENDNNIRFFLESAYNNFSQGVKMYLDSIDKFMGALTSYTLKNTITDSVKSEGSNAFTRYFNRCVDEAKEKITASDKAKTEQLEKECEILEMSFVGKAMCEYYMKEFSLCIESIDNAIGVHIKPWLNMVGRLNTVCADQSVLCAVFEYPHKRLYGLFSYSKCYCIQLSTQV